MFLTSYKGGAIDSINRQNINAVWVDDDNSFFLRTVPIFPEMFKLSGQRFKIEPFASPIPALAKIRKHPPDIVLTNLYMPHPGGVDFIWGIREINKVIPIIVVSSRHHPMILEAITVAGANAYCYKGDLRNIEGVQQLQLEIDALTSQTASNVIR